MPQIEPELLPSLTAITDILLKRPGLISITSIKRLSNIYGFETFTDTLNSSGRPITSPVNDSYMAEDNQNKGIINRLSISGLILLIDVDFEGDSRISSISISSAITPDLIDGKNYNFITGFDGFESVGQILWKNLQGKTLDSFNKNLRILMLIDRLSRSKPNDLLTLFSKLCYQLKSEHELEKKKYVDGGNNDGEDWEDGVKGVGKLMINQKDKIGIFLKYWVDDRFVNRWIKKEKRLDFPVREYFIHFKIKESLKYEENKKDISNTGTENQDIEVIKRENNILGEKDSKSKNEFIKEEGVFVDGESIFNENDTILKENLNLLVLEMCPSIWVPEDIMVSINVDYEVINEENQFFADNMDNEMREEDRQIDLFFKIINEHGSAVLHDKVEGNMVDIDIDYLVGCKMIKLFKVQLGDLRKLHKLVNILRSWCKVNSIVRKIVKRCTITPENENPGKELTEVDLNDVFTDVATEFSTKNKFITISGLETVTINYNNLITILDGHSDEPLSEATETLLE